MKSLPLILLVVLGVGAAGCGGNDSSDGAMLGFVSANDFGKDWPFTVSEGAISCTGDGTVDALVFRPTDDSPYAGETFALNGLATSSYPDAAPIDPIWKHQKGNKTLRMSLGPMIAAGHDVCAQGAESD